MTNSISSCSKIDTQISGNGPLKTNGIHFNNNSTQELFGRTYNNVAYDLDLAMTFSIGVTNQKVCSLPKKLTKSSIPPMSLLAHVGPKYGV